MLYSGVGSWVFLYSRIAPLQLCSSPQSMATMTIHSHNDQVCSDERYEELLRRLDRVEALLSRLVDQRAGAAGDGRHRGERLRLVAGKLGNIALKRLAREIMSRDTGKPISGGHGVDADGG